MNQLLSFVALTKKFRDVKRMITFSDGSRENDAEHSFQLAITAWYLIDAEKLSLDANKVFKYALAHDLVETYAGDTPAAIHKKFAKDSETKKEREEQAARRLKQEFPEFAELHEIIDRYEKRADEEARFVNALDKILPLMNIYLDEGHSWKVHSIGLEDLIANKRERIKDSPSIEKYFGMIEKLLRAKPSLFS